MTPQLSMRSGSAGFSYSDARHAQKLRKIHVPVIVREQ